MGSGSDPSPAETEKRVAAARAADLVEDGMIVGLGSGSTAEYAIEILGERIHNEDLEITGVATSFQAGEAARRAGIPQTPTWAVDVVDLVIDGADQVSGSNVIKGGGGAHVMEKIVATMANSVTIIVDSSKLSDKLDRPVPIAVVPDAWQSVEKKCAALGGEARTRTSNGKVGPIISDNGNVILDVDFGPIENPRSIATKISAIPGVVDHGLFIDIADMIIIGSGTETDIQRF